MVQAETVIQFIGLAFLFIGLFVAWLSGMDLVGNLTVGVVGASIAVVPFLVWYVVNLCTSINRRKQ